MQAKVNKSSNSFVNGQIQEARITLRRNDYSRFRHKCTTVETLLVEKGRGVKVMRAVELYTVRLLIERGAGDDTQVEMPSDMQEIAQKQANFSAAM
ncbi:hypothetical protein Tcan_08486 [Toxocara canis]|uniref:Uncharacterized protein n=1 Tax=Toxocara canis TaxID=6265 RepID=A0A0B2VMY5_TOXCA|nr:hypothetical protein Tcan_08486 [Toxocara canis]